MSYLLPPILPLNSRIQPPLNDFTSFRGFLRLPSLHPLRDFGAGREQRILHRLVLRRLHKIIDVEDIGGVLVILEGQTQHLSIVSSYLEVRVDILAPPLGIVCFLGPNLPQEVIIQLKFLSSLQGTLRVDTVVSLPNPLLGGD